eukprot:1195898-Prorocentrum_minimum.AAC.2
MLLPLSTNGSHVLPLHVYFKKASEPAAGKEIPTQHSASTALAIQADAELKCDYCDKTFDLLGLCVATAMKRTLPRSWLGLPCLISCTKTAVKRFMGLSLLLTPKGQAS